MAETGADAARGLEAILPSRETIEGAGVHLRRAFGYYEVPNVRIVYSENGVVHSFGIASMISWRGIWYVIHLGAILRPGAGGVVDDPASGPGESIPSSTC